MSLEFSGNFSNNQEVFDFITNNVILQNQPSCDRSGHPTFQERPNIRCPIGWLITAEEYKNWPSAEDPTYISPIDYIINKGVNSFLIYRLQNVHDLNTSIFRAIVKDTRQANFIECFKEDIQSVAEQFKLVYETKQRTNNLH